MMTCLVVSNMLHVQPWQSQTTFIFFMGVAQPPGRLALLTLGEFLMSSMFFKLKLGWFLWSSVLMQELGKNMMLRVGRAVCCSDVLPLDTDEYCETMWSHVKPCETDPFLNQIVSTWYFQYFLHSTKIGFHMPIRSQLVSCHCGNSFL